MNCTRAPVIILVAHLNNLKFCTSISTHTHPSVWYDAQREQDSILASQSSLFGRLFSFACFCSFADLRRCSPMHSHRSVRTFLQTFVQTTATNPPILIGNRTNKLNEIQYHRMLLHDFTNYTSHKCPKHFTSLSEIFNATADRWGERKPMQIVISNVDTHTHTQNPRFIRVPTIPPKTENHQWIWNIRNEAFTLEIVVFSIFGSCCCCYYYCGVLYV